MRMIPCLQGRDVGHVSHLNGDFTDSCISARERERERERERICYAKGHSSAEDAVRHPVGEQDP